MARIPLGALSTLNTSLHLDPMFVEIYSGAFAGFTFSSSFFGIGKTPTRAIDVVGTGAFSAGNSSAAFQNGEGFLVINNTSASGLAGLQFNSNGTSAAFVGLSGPTNMVFGTGASGTLSERMRIDSSGNVGIGGAPTQKLDVSGNLRCTGEIAISGSDFLYSWAGGATGDRRAGFYLDGATQAVRVYTAAAERMRIDASGHVASGVDNTQTMGTAAKRWSVVYAGTGTINTSDAREKTEVSEMSPAEIAAARDLAREIGVFRFLGAMAAKGEDARLHIGMTVQRAMEVMSRHGLDPRRYAFICHDQWPEEEAPAGDRYGFRSDELMLFIARGFEARLSALEAGA